MKVLWTSILLFCGLQVSAQHALDSLMNIYWDTTQVITDRWDMVAQMWQVSGFDAAGDFAREKVGYYLEHGNRRQQADAFLLLGRSEPGSNRVESIGYYMQSLELYTELSDAASMAYVMNLIALTYGIGLDQVKPMEWYINALFYAKKAGIDDVSSSIEANIGLEYLKRKDYSSGIKYYKSALETMERIRDSSGLDNILNIGTCHDGLTECYIGLKEYELALKEIQLSVATYEEANSAYEADSYLLMARIFLLTGKHQEALDICQKVTDIISGFNQDHPKNIRRNFGVRLLMGQVQLEERLFTLAISSCQQGLQLAEKLGDLSSQKEACECLYKAHKGLNNLGAALHYIESINSIGDSMLLQRTAENLVSLEFQKAVLQDSIQRADEEKIQKMAVAEEQRRNERTRNAGIVGGVILLIVSGGLWSRLRYQRKAQKALNEAKERAERSEAFKQQFLANMSHEIRTPMNAVMGMTDLVLESDISGKNRDYLTKVKKSSDNLLHIINDILDLSKIEAGKMELEHIDMSLTDTLDLVKNTLRHKADEKGLQLFIRVDQDVDDVVIGDPVRLNQVLINLCGNAIKFTERGSVSIEVKKSDGKVRFAVIDTGIGISKDKLEAVFENFNQANTSDTRKYGGTGLGLSISQQLVGLMGGSIRVESTEGSGTTFYFEIVLDKGNPERLEQRLASEENVDGSILDGLTILVADDNEYNRIVARDTLLSKANVNVIEAENGQEVLDKLTQEIDVILMDAQMPVMSGFESTKRIRAMADEKLKHIPVIALTASVLRTDLDRCTEAGMNGYLPKPFKTHDLIIEIAKTLNIELKYSGMKNSIKASPVERSNGTITDLTYLRNFCEGDEKKMQMYIDMFLRSAPVFIEKINKLIEEHNAAGLATQLHGFHTNMVMMGMNDLRSETLELENKLKAGQLNEDLVSVVKNLTLQIKRAKSELNVNFGD